MDEEYIKQLEEKVNKLESNLMSLNIKCLHLESLLTGWLNHKLFNDYFIRTPHGTIFDKNYTYKMVPSENKCIVTDGYTSVTIQLGNQIIT